MKRPPHPAWLVALACVTYSYMLGNVANKAQLHLIYYPPLLALDGLQPLNIAYGTVFCVFMFRLWKLAQQSNMRAKKPSPAKAVGYLFIPFFNLYWAFVLHRSLALHLNHLTVRQKIPTKAVTVGLALCSFIILVEFICWFPLLFQYSAEHTVQTAHGLVLKKGLLSHVYVIFAVYVILVWSVYKILLIPGSIMLLITYFYFYRASKELLKK